MAGGRCKADATLGFGKLQYLKRVSEAMIRRISALSDLTPANQLAAPPYNCDSWWELMVMLAYDGILSVWILELALIALIGAAVAGVHPLVSYAAIAAVTLKLLLERCRRWPFTPAALALVGLVPRATAAAWPLLALGAALCLAIPQPRGLEPFAGPYGVGSLDAQLEIDGVAFLVRALYPTELRPRARGACALAGAPYYALQPRRTCVQLMRTLAPSGLRSGPLLHLMDHLGLVRAEMATARPGTAPPPMAGPQRAAALVFSHGMMTLREQYAGILGELASRGVVVLIVEHTDGSAVLARLPDGHTLPYAHEVDGLRGAEYTHARRRQVDARAREACAALKAAAALARAQAASPEPAVPGGAGDMPVAGLRPGKADVGCARQLLGLLGGRLDGARIAVAGHSMGGATALAAAMGAHEPPAACVCLDPVLDWVPAEAARVAYAGAAGSAPVCAADEARPLLAPPERALERTPVLALYSAEWRQAYFAGEGGVGDALRSVRARFSAGGVGGSSHFAFVRGSTHATISDVPIMLPRWLARALGAVTADASAAEVCLRFRETIVRFCEVHGLCAPSTPHSVRARARRHRPHDGADPSSAAHPPDYLQDSLTTAPAASPSASRDRSTKSSAYSTTGDDSSRSRLAELSSAMMLNMRKMV